MWLVKIFQNEKNFHFSKKCDFFPYTIFYFNKFLITSDCVT